MKLERNGIVLITFVCTFVILLLFSLMTSGSLFDIKGIFIALYFSVWVGAFFFVLMTFVIPYIREHKKTAKKKAKPASQPSITPPPFRSPRSGLPLRERITAYVAERRKEDGLQPPEPLRPSQKVPSGTVSSSSARRTGSVIAPPPVSGSRGTSVQTGSGGDDLGDLPLPDDLGSVDDAGDNLGSLPGLDGDMDDLGDFGDEISSGPDDDTGGIPADNRGGAVSSGTLSPSSAQQGSEAVLPDFDGDLTADFGESDLMSDDGIGGSGIDALSSDDLLVMDEGDSFSSSSASSSPSPLSDGLSDDGLPDLDGDLEPDMMDTDLSGDEDFGDIEFMDLEPEEPKKRPVK